MSNSCLNCGEDISVLRSDASFCNQNCRRKYNRKQARQERESVKALIEMSDEVVRLPTLNGILQCDPVTAKRLQAMGYG